MKRIFLIDGSALVHRSFHAFSRTQLSTQGMDVGMIYGFLLSILMICRKEKPDRLAITFDTGAPTFRHKMYAEYKAHRPPLDEAIRVQLPLLYEVIDLLNIPRLAKDGWEADDLMGTLATKGEASGYDVFLVSGDKDFYQLVTDQVKVYSLPTKKEPNPIVYDPDGVKVKFGVKPELVIDALALMGDSSDNVPGVPKVGHKTAIKLLDEYGDLDGVLASASQVKQNKIRENLIEFADQARFSKELVIIDREAPIDSEPDTLVYGPMNNSEVRRKLTEMEFYSILKQLGEIEPIEAPLFDSPSAKQGEKSLETATLPMEHDEVGVSSRKYRTVINPDELQAMIDELSKAELISMDTETTSLDPMRAELVGLSFSIRENEAWYVSVNYFEEIPEDYVSFPSPCLRPNTSSELAFILDQLRPLFADSNLPKTGQNLKYDIHILRCYDVPVDGVVFDTMIASYVLDPTVRQRNIDALAQKHLAITKIPTKQLIGSGAKQKSMTDVPLDIITEYACEDADVALRLTNLFRSGIEAEGFTRLMYEQELPLMEVLLKMEHNGVALDQELLAGMSETYRKEIIELEQDVYNLAGHEFNMNSTQQLANVLFNQLGLPPGRKTKFGFSTDIDELQRLAPVHELPAKLLRYRHLTKLKSTYIDSLPRMIHPVTGRVHTSYSQTVAATGRLSSNDPNLQNIPIRTEEGGRIRKAFIAGSSNWKIISADYSQVELRIMAHLSGDERLVQVFHDGQDIHTATAAWMHDMPPELITSDMRRHAKEVNFGVLYGMGGFGLAQRLGISRKRANEFIEQYFSKFWRVKEFIEEIKEKARRNGYVETIMGRKRTLPDINARSYQIRQNAERIAINTPIQGSAADLMKKAMIDVHKMLQNEGFQARMLLQVHDELIFEAPIDEVNRLSERVKEVMEGAMELNVPLEVDVSWGDNWLDAHE